MNVRELIDRGPMTGLQIRIIAICLALNMLDGIDVLSMSFAAPALSKDWGISPETLGAVFSAAPVGMMAGSLLLAPLGDSIGRRKLIVVSLAVIAAGMLGTALCGSVWQLVVLRFAAGLGLGGIVASMAAIAAEFSPARRRNFAVTIVQGGYPLGSTVTGLVAGWMIPHFGWRSLFAAGGLVAALGIVVAWRYMAESLEFLLSRQPAGALAEINALLRGMGHTELDALPPKPAPAASGRLPLLAALERLLAREHRSSTLLIWVAFFTSFTTLYFLLSWVPQLAANTGLSVAAAIFAGTVFNLGGFVGMTACGYFSDHFGLKRVITLFLAVGTVVMVAFSSFTTPTAIVTGLGALGLMQGGFIALYAAATRIYPTEIRSTGVGWAVGAGRPGAILGPYVAGLLVAAGLNLGQSFAVFAIPLAISAVAVALIPSPELRSPRGGRAAEAASEAGTAP